jgi:hypothetical protein
MSRNRISFGAFSSHPTDGALRMENIELLKDFLSGTN